MKSPDVILKMDSNVVPLRPRFERRADYEFLPGALEVLETPMSPLGRAVAALIALFFLVALAWSYLGHVDIIASATGKTIPTGKSKVIQPLEPGIVSAIHVQDGDHVRAGDPWAGS
jgi:hemolysin D